MKRTRSPSTLNAKLDNSSSAANIFGQDAILKDFMAWESPRLSIPDLIDSRATTGTRKPAFFDIHLHPSLRLKKVVLVRDLARRLEASFRNDVPSQLHSHRAAGGNQAPEYFSDVLDAQDFKRHPVNESDIVNNYSLATGVPCARIASTLLFRLKQDWTSRVLKWRKQSENKQGHAIADGFLSCEHAPEIQPGSETAADIELITRYHLQNIAVWEMKSLVAGCEEVMREIGKLAFEAEFPWATCGSEIPGITVKESGPACSGDNQHLTNGRVTISGRKTGPDAETTSQYWMPVDQAPVSKKPKYDGNEKKKNQLHRPTSQAEFLEGSSRTPRLGDLRLAYGPGPVVKRNGVIVMRPKTKKKKPKEFKGSRTKAIYITQQGWAEAVANDASFIIFHSGNHELIGIRHRETQTLYLSELIYIPDLRVSAQSTMKDKLSCQTYHILHSALFQACYKDVLERVNKLHAWATQPARNDQDMPLYALSYDRDGINYAIKAPAPTIAPETPQKITEDFERGLHQNDLLKITIPIGEVPAGEQFAKFRRMQMPGGERSNPPTMSAVLHLSPKVEINPGVWLFNLTKGSANGTSTDTYAKDLVIKFGQDVHFNNINRAFTVYNSLSSLLVAPRPYGLFKCVVKRRTAKGVDQDTPVYALVMEYVGTDLKQLRTLKGGSQSIEKSRLGFRNNLRAIHGAGYRINGKLDAQHLVLLINNKLGISRESFVGAHGWSKVDKNESKRASDESGEREMNTLDGILAYKVEETVKTESHA